MSNENLISLFPQQRIKAYDGMPVTADTWERAHTYHRSAMQSHNLFFHGEGILTGLEVIASDPPDNIIYVLPGIAVDALGQLIVLPEPVAYDLGNEVEGPLYLVISHRESATGVEKSMKQGQPQQIHDEFLLLARSEIPEGVWVELARFNRENRNAPIADAPTHYGPAQPQQNQIDLRFRRKAVVETEKRIIAAVAYAGGGEKSYGAGLGRLAGELRALHHIHLVVDDNQQIAPGLLRYDVVFLVGEGKFTLNKNQVEGLKGYLERGGVLVLEAGDDSAAGQFEAFAGQAGIALEPPGRGNALLSEPHLFATPPSGYRETGRLLAGGGVVFSTFQYGRLWNGEIEGRPAQRHELRSAVEWGANLLAYVLRTKEK